MNSILNYLPHLIAFLAGGGALRVANYIAKALPALPKDAGWWKQFAYSLVKGLSGLDPNTVSLKSFDGTERRTPNGNQTQLPKT